ncbi:hypothetical protein E1162_09300 [Rhodobacteraceae bacterium RKSG542]|uniref:hypothetical protein n=1 Tax=Pseudovibrio flavus TaxID=2529854 RepID=UPI0012BBCDCD|nr:hypothetical protein [Pseudovibrio flavus]MTI17434.1 hypothetical protein [Pseudovibrio flavus]
MDDGGDGVGIFFVIIIIALAIWFFRHHERVQQRQRQEEQERVRKRSEAYEEYDQYVSQKIPASVARSNGEFLRDNPLPYGEDWYGEDVSPLTFYGYRVGKTRGLRPNERRAIISYVMRARLTEPLAPSYQRGWGAPLSFRRREAIVSHIDRLAAQRVTRPGYEVAVSDWEEDSLWAIDALDEEISKWGRYDFE